jgi:hypothetical protein
MEGRIHHDGVSTPGVLVSEQYRCQLLSDTGLPTYKFEFSNGPALEPNTSYWIVFTTSDARDWKTGYNQNVTSSIDAGAGLAYTTHANVGPDQVQNYGWYVIEEPTMILNLIISGCEAILEPTPTAVVTQLPVPTRTPKASPSATPRVVLTPITANVTSSFDSTQTSLNLTAPASSTLCCTSCMITHVRCV